MVCMEPTGTLQWIWPSISCIVRRQAAGRARRRLIINSSGQTKQSVAGQPTPLSQAANNDCLTHARHSSRFAFSSRMIRPEEASSSSILWRLQVDWRDTRRRVSEARCLDNRSKARQIRTRARRKIDQGSRGLARRASMNPKAASLPTSAVRHVDAGVEKKGSYFVRCVLAEKSPAATAAGNLSWAALFPARPTLDASGRERVPLNSAAEIRGSSRRPI